MNFHIKSKEPWFSSIVVGQKKIEAQFCKNEFTEIKVGDFITFEDSASTRTIKTQVHELHLYPSFEQLFQTAGLSNIFPGIVSLENALKLSPIEEEKLYSIIAIHFKLCPNEKNFIVLTNFSDAIVKSKVKRETANKPELRQALIYQ